MSDDFWSDWGTDFSGGGVYDVPDYSWNIPAYEPAAYDPVAVSYYLPPATDYNPVPFTYQPFSLSQPGAYQATQDFYPETEPGGLGGSGAASIVAYDPSTGTFFDSAGNPVQPQSGGPTGGDQYGPAFTGSRATDVLTAGGTLNPNGAPAGTGGEKTWADAITSFLKSGQGMEGTIRRHRQRSD